MDDALHAFDRALDLAQTARSALHEGLVGARSAGAVMIAPANVGIDALSSLRSRVPMPPAAPVTKTVCMMLSSACA